MLEHYDCGQTLDQEGFHLITCKYGGGPVWSYDIIVAEWSACLTELGIPHQTEARNRYVQTDERPDITFYDIGSGVTYEYDVSLAHLWRKDIVNRAAKACRHAATKRESEECYKYSKEILPDGSSSEIVLLVFEHFGTWGSQAENLLHELRRKPGCIEERRVDAEFISYWQRLFSVTLQECNSKAVLRKVSKLLTNRLMEDNVVSR